MGYQHQNKAQKYVFQNVTPCCLGEIHGVTPADTIKATVGDRHLPTVQYYKEDALTGFWLPFNLSGACLKNKTKFSNSLDQFIFPLNKIYNKNNAIMI
jgi:hypothetical protein